MSTLETLFEKAQAARKNAYAPYSKFLVGTCIETKNGSTFVGCNVENASYGLAVCSESNAIAAMVAAGQREIKQLVVVVKGPKVSTCCGSCRQRLYEFGSPDTLIHFATEAGIQTSYRLDTLLPHAFGPKDVE